MNEFFAQLEEELESIKPTNTNLVRFNGRDTFKMDLITFLSKPEYHYCLFAYPGIGKSTTVIKALQEMKLNFVYLASTKKTANQLGKDNNLPVVHGDSDATPTKQSISIYDHIDKYVNWDDLEKTKNLVLVVDECHLIIQQRSHKFRAKVLRKIERFKNYFSKVIYLTATPIDFRAYGDNLEIIQVEDNREPLEVYAVAYESDELPTIAGITKNQFDKGFKSVIYLQSKGNNLQELKFLLTELGITNIQILNSVDNSLYLDGELLEDDLIDGYIKADVLITTFADGLSFRNQDEFVFTSSSTVDVYTSYQAMHRLRAGYKRAFYLTKASTYNHDFSEVYENAYNKYVGIAEEIKRKLIKIPGYSDRAVFYNVLEPLVDLDGSFITSQISNEALKEAHKVSQYDYKCLKTGFESLNVKLIKAANFVMEYELEKDYVPDSKRKILESIFFSLNQSLDIPWPSHYSKELEKVNQLLKHWNIEKTKEFMLNEYLDRPTSFDEIIMSLNLLDNPKDSQLRLRLDKLITDKSFTAEELHNIVETEVRLINHPWNKKKYDSLVRGLGFEISLTSEMVNGSKVHKKSITRKL